MKKIGIIGSGVVAQTLGSGFIKHGYEVMLGTRNVSKLKEWHTNDGKGSQLGSFAEAASFGNIVVVAAKGTAAKAALALAGAENLKGKTIIDAANPIADAAPVNGVLNYFTSMNESLMEQLQTSFPEAHFVKAFSCVGSPFFINPSFDSKPTMFICGNNEGAKKEVTEILDLFGWETADFGMVESARAIEPLCMLWCIPGMAKNEWTHAFKLLKL